MKHECSAEDMEVAHILLTLPRLVWEADHGLPCTHNLRWGARKRRSDGGDEPQEPNAPAPAAAPPPPPPPPRPPLPQPAAAEKPSKKRRRDHVKPCPAPDVSKGKASEEAAAAAAAGGSGAPDISFPSLRHPPPSSKDMSADADLGDHQTQPTAAAVAGPPEALGPVHETSSPNTPLDFCPSGEEVDGVAKAKARPSEARRPPAKKPRLKPVELSKQVDQLSRTRTELQLEAAEIRNRLEALRERNSDLIELRNKLAKETGQHPPQVTDQHLHRTSCLDLHPTDPARPTATTCLPDHLHQTQPLQQQQQPQYQHAWPQPWASNPVVFHQVPRGLSVHPSLNQHWNWAASQTLRLDGDNDGSRTSKVPDLNSSADMESGVECRQYPHQQQQQGNYFNHPQRQQAEQRKVSPEEQRAARKKRLERMHKRRSAAGATAGGGGCNMPGFR